MRLFLFGFLFAFVLIFAAGYGYIALGMAPVATSSGPLPFEKLITGIALDARVSREAPTSSPIQPSTNVYLAGVKIYQSNCAVCHGLPGEAQSPIALGEIPTPPELFKGKGVTDDSPGETYWKVSNGIRLTGMPGFGNSLTKEQMWQVSLLLTNVDKLPAEAQSALRADTNQ
jgi:thiosulfate dehydrogenase